MMTGQRLGKTLYQNLQRTDTSLLRGEQASLADMFVLRLSLRKAAPLTYLSTSALIALLFLDPHVVLTGRVIQTFLHILPKPIETG